MSFRALSDRHRPRWHFCENCPGWPWFGSDEDDDPPREEWCKTCVLMYTRGTGDLEVEQTGAVPGPVYIALVNAFSTGDLDLRRDPPKRGTPAMHAALAGLDEILKPN